MNSFPQTTWRSNLEGSSPKGYLSPEEGYIVVFDATNSSRKQWSLILRFAKEHDYRVFIESNDPDTIAENKDGGAGERSILEISWCHAWGQLWGPGRQAT